jgi:hypothetical protein
MIYCAYFHSQMNHGIIFWGNSSYSNKVFKLHKTVVRILTGSMSRDSGHDLFKNLKFLFPSYVLLLETMNNTCLTQRYIEEILDRLQISINQYRIYHCFNNRFLRWVLKCITIYHLS